MHRRLFWQVSCVLSAAASATTACSPANPTKTVVQTLTVTCPVVPPVTATNGQSATVTYTPPNVVGGAPPASVTCTPASGTTFAVGSNAVTCTATDAAHTSDTCSFLVTVSAAPRLGVTRILAFGDSITEGEVPMAGEFSFGIRPMTVQLQESYPANLTTLLAARYTVQGATRLDSLMQYGVNMTDCLMDPPPPVTTGILVINAGCQGELAEDPSTVARLTDKMSAYQPDLVLLLEGTNDPTPSGVQGVVNLVTAVRNSRVPIMVSTLLPEIAMDLTHGGQPDLIVPFNDQLKPAVAAAGASVVDVYADIATDVTDWISPYDGLHPTAAGYAEMARVWFGAIQEAFETSPAAPIQTTGRSRSGVRR